ncbi:MAG: helix-turn-helix transcriptional regulator [Clostridia bacterium]|nr:helix-turn-helix transcriptional regulator [Clostridia bacterium]MBR5145207.1 helix-turn-helix transcriptional regulator [Clostridia bacterium]
MKVFQERLFALRKEFEYTQREVAQMLGISQPSYIRYENGTSQPNLQTLAKIADIFDVSVDYLLGREKL